MRAVQDALFDVIVGLPEVVSWVGTYRGAPAIFARSPVPAEVLPRYIVIRDAFADVPGLMDTKTTTGRNVVHDIAVYKDEDGDPSDIADIATLIRDTIQRNQMPVSGYGNALITKASGPIEADEDQVYGRVITASLEIGKA